MIRNIINLKAIILYFRLILCLIAGMPTPAYGSSSYPVKEESYVLVINSYVDGERWSGNLLNMISKFATPEEYTLRIDHISVMLVDTPEKLKEKQEVFFEANKKKPDGIIYLGVNGWAFLPDLIPHKSPSRRNGGIFPLWSVRRRGKWQKMNVILIRGIPLIG